MRGRGTVVSGAPANRIVSNRFSRSVPIPACHGCRRTGIDNRSGIAANGCLENSMRFDAIQRIGASYFLRTAYRSVPSNTVCDFGPVRQRGTMETDFLPLTGRESPRFDGSHSHTGGNIRRRTEETRMLIIQKKNSPTLSSKNEDLG